MRVELSPGARGLRWAVIRPITGHDEVALDAEQPGAGSGLVERLLCAVPGAAVGPGSSGSLTVADRDKLLAAVYRSCFGDRIDAVAVCTACGQSFALEFGLDDLCRLVEGDAGADVPRPDAEGLYRAEDGTRFRLVQVADLTAVRDLAPDDAVATLLDRCVAQETGDFDPRGVQEAMERLAPTLDLDARCAYCETAQSVAFSLEAYCVQALVQERRFLVSEVHRLAVAYGWGLDEILSLSRDDRRTLVRHVDGERALGLAP